MIDLERLDEAELLERARKRDDDAFAVLVQAYQRPVYNLCYRMLGDPGEAEDAAQESFLRAYRGLDRFNPDRSFKTWLLSIASHYCIDQLRKRRLVTVPLDSMQPGMERPDASPGPEAAVSSGESRREVEGLLRALGAKDRATVVLRYWYDMSYEEIAAALSLTVSAVKSRLHRARGELAVRWLEHQAQPVANGGHFDEASAF